MGAAMASKVVVYSSAHVKQLSFLPFWGDEQQMSAYLVGGKADGHAVRGCQQHAVISVAPLDPHQLITRLHKTGHSHNQFTSTVCQLSSPSGGPWCKSPRDHYAAKENRRNEALRALQQRHTLARQPFL
jgi:hypothetical protein